MDFLHYKLATYHMLNSCTNIEVLIRYILDMFPLLDDLGLPEKQNKNNFLSKGILLAGDSLVRSQEFEEAIIAYTNAIRVAVPNTNILGGCFYHRANAFEKLKAYEEAIIDLKQALSLVKPSIKKNITEKIKELNSKLQNTNIQEKCILSNDMDLFISEENDEISGCSSAMKLSHNSQYGRHFLAAKEIKASTVLLIQKPFMFVIFDDKRLLYCHHCGKNAKALLPCDSCPIALYCSEKCRKEAYDQYHEIECNIGIVCEKFRLFLIVTKKGTALRQIMSITKRKIKPKDLRTAGFVENQFISNTVEAVLSLHDHFSKKPNMEQIVNSCLEAVLLKRKTNLLDGHNIYDVIELMYKLNCILLQNIVVVRGKHLKDPIGVALYPVFNLLNHSCVSNTIWYNKPNLERVLIASKDINNGEQIFGNYITQQTVLMSCDERKEFLKTFKHFTCHCEACENDYDFTSELKQLKLPILVQKKLQNDPIHIKSMWQMIKCMYEQVKKPCIEIEMIKFAIMDAYFGYETDFLKGVYRKLRIS